MKWGQTSCSERRKALGTELSSRLMRGPTRANRVPTIKPGTTSEEDATALKTIRITSASSKRPHGRVRSTVQHGLGRLVALHRTDQALEHAGVEGQPQGGGGEQDGPDHRPDAQVVHGDLGVEGALNRIEPEDDQSGHDHPGRLHPGRAPGHRDQLLGWRGWCRGWVARRRPIPCRPTPCRPGRVAGAHAGFHRRRRIRTAAGRGRRAPSAHRGGDGPRPESLPSGASKPSSVNPAAAKSARMAGV